MDPTFQFPATPGMPLFPVSPERVNQRRSNSIDDPFEPRVSESALFAAARKAPHGERRTGRHKSSVSNNQEWKDDYELALNRAKVGREVAESEVIRCREANERLMEDVEEGMERERRVAKRVEDLMEEKERSDTLHTRTLALYEKEIRRARKETFKVNSANVKVHEELKATREALRVAQAELEGERESAKSHEEDAFEARYELVGVTEELTRLSEQIKLVEEERDALKTNLKEEEVARIAAEGRVALPNNIDDDDRDDDRDDDHDDEIEGEAQWQPSDIQSFCDLACCSTDPQVLLKYERARVKDLEGLVEFMKVENNIYWTSYMLCQEMGLKVEPGNPLGNEILEQGQEGEIVFEETRQSERADSHVTPPSPSHVEQGPHQYDTSDLLVLSSPPRPPPHAQLPPITVETSLLSLLTAPAEHEVNERGDEASKHSSDASLTLAESLSTGAPNSTHSLSANDASPDDDFPNESLNSAASLTAPSQNLSSGYAPSDNSTAPKSTSPEPARTPSPTSPISPSPHSSSPSPPPTTPHRSYTSHTITIPLAAAADVFTPSAMTREERLAAIDRRRGRARSVAAPLTPRRPLRDVSGASQPRSGAPGPAGATPKSIGGPRSPRKATTARRDISAPDWRRGRQRGRADEDGDEGSGEPY
ncbi:MAG: hypothetical protein M1833_001985 [Piccolia ochrophora]|nr:MAG: hypothetical protein M1833_001985 [Piccolia ochrophora]